jgi:hypothetical protein
MTSVGSVGRRRRPSQMIVHTMRCIAFFVLRSLFFGPRPCAGVHGTVRGLWRLDCVYVSLVLSEVARSH